ncbi:hypothetical protein AB0903_33585 [Streptomyces sp. NPDC048389]|uniref:hypothetical protein n=1 Tax=Streptomyces sp. NPDC048389 TaxID=3154622 RepID=UPI0034549E5B
MHDRPIPTPGDVAARPPLSYDRHGWERAIRYSQFKPDVRLVAMMLAHHADADGHIPSGHALIAGRLAKACGLRPDDRVRGALGLLEKRGYLSRPRGERGPNILPRPVTLTLPPGHLPTAPDPRPGSHP